MSVTNDNLIRTRVLIDFDQDGWINTEVLDTAPPNLMPDALYVSGANMRRWMRNANTNGVPTIDQAPVGDTIGVSGGTNWTYDTTIDTATNSERGLVNREASLFLNGNSNDTERWSLLWRGYKKYQRGLGYPSQLIPNSANNYFDPTTVYQLGGIPATGAAAAALTHLAALPDQVYSASWGQEVGNGVLRWSYDSTRKLVAAIGYKGSNTTYQANGYIGSGLSGAINTAAQFSGWAVTAGQSYTIRFSMLVPPNSTSATALDFALNNVSISVTVVGNNGAAGSPNYGRTAITSSISPSSIVQGTDFWQDYYVTFTVPSGVTQVALDLQATNFFIGDVYLSKFAMWAGTVTTSFIYDNNVIYDADNFTHVFAGDNKTYTFSFWLKGRTTDDVPNFRAGTDYIEVDQYVIPLGGSTSTKTTLSNITVTGDWQQIVFRVAADTVDRGVIFFLKPHSVNVHFPVGYRATVDVDGFQITEGTTVYPYHAGDLYGKEDISSYVLNINTEAGKDDFNAALPNEGMATIVVNNDSRVFSPENEDSPFYGHLKPNLKVRIQFQDTNSVWQDIWTGWTAEFDVNAGRNVDRQATIIANQGMFRLSEGVMNLAIQRYQKMDTIARKIISGSGWRTTKNVLQSYLGYRTEVGANAFIDADSLLYDVVEEGVNTLELAGKDWGSTTDPRAALDELIGAENGSLFITRTGAISIFNRNHWISSILADSFTLDTNVNQAEYSYGEDIVNAIEVTVNKNKVNTNVAVWETKRPTPLRTNQVWVVDLNPEFTEGKNKTVITYDAKNLTKTVYTADTGLDGTNATASQEQADLVKAEVIGEAGSRPQIRLTNSNSTTMWVSLSIKGDYVDGGDSETVKVEDKESIDELQGRHVQTYSSPVITNYRQAQSYGETILLRQATPKGEFKSFTILVRNTDDLARVMTLKVGDLISISEIQSDVEALSHGIIGEEWKLTNSRQLEVTYHVARTLQESFAKADISVVLDETANMISDMTSGVAFGGGGSFETARGVSYGLDKIMVWSTGGGYNPSLILAPARQQVRSIAVNSNALSYPDTDGSGNIFIQQTTFSDAISRKLRAYSALWQIASTNKGILWYRPLARAAMAAAGTAGVVIGGRRSKTTDDSVGAAAWWDLLIPIQPDELYEARAHTLLDNPNNLVGGTNATGGALAALAKNGTLLLTWANASNTATTPSAISGVNEANYKMHHKFKARDGSGAVTTTALQVYKKANVLETEGLASLDLVRYSGYTKTGGIRLDLTRAHYYTVFIRADYGAISPTSVTLELFNEAGSSITSTTVSVVSTSLTKIQLTIPSGNKSAWGWLSTPPNGVNQKYLIYAWGITKTAINTYSELLAENSRELVFA